MEWYFGLTYFIGAWYILPVILRATVLRRRYCKSKRRLDGKVALVTGANTGLGKYSARDLAERGAKVYMACRNPLKAEQAKRDIEREFPDAKLFLLNLDLSSLTSVRDCARAFLKEERQLDIFMANAGIGMFTHEKTAEGVEWHLGCNHLAHFLLTRLLLPVIDKTGSPDRKARIVVLSSSAHEMGGVVKRIDYERLQEGKARYMAYGQSKLANLLFVRKLDQLLSGRNVSVNGVHPGPCDTEFLRYLVPSRALQLAVGATILFPPSYLLMNSTEEGAQTQVYAAVDEQMEGVSGKYLANCALLRPSAAALDDDQADELWRWSCEKTGLPLELQELAR